MVVTSSHQRSANDTRSSIMCVQSLLDTLHAPWREFSFLRYISQEYLTTVHGGIMHCLTFPEVGAIGLGHGSPIHGLVEDCMRKGTSVGNALSGLSRDGCLRTRWRSFRHQIPKQ